MFKDVITYCFVLKEQFEIPRILLKFLNAEVNGWDGT